MRCNTAQVAGAVRAARQTRQRDKPLLRLLRPVEVAACHLARRHKHLAHLALLNELEAVGVAHADVDAGDGVADRQALEV
eukprot:350847-Chlamydomonas_euryale.AAC.9